MTARNPTSPTIIFVDDGTKPNIMTHRSLNFLGEGWQKLL
jgi:hypothetical protein